MTYLWLTLYNDTAAGIWPFFFLLKLGKQNQENTYKKKTDPFQPRWCAYVRFNEKNDDAGTRKLTCWPADVVLLRVDKQEGGFLFSNYLFL